jgi:hypothetical protein
MSQPLTHTLLSKGEKAVDQILQMHQTEGFVRIALSHFREVFLPLLASPEKDKDISAWLAFVKHPMAEVHVLDENNKLVYVVPPVVATVSTGIAARNRPSLDSEMVTTYQKIERSPRNATAIMSESLNQHLQVPKNILSNRIRMNQILVAEGYPPLPIPGTKAGFTGTGTALKDSITGEPKKERYSDEYDEI